MTDSLCTAQAHELLNNLKPAARDSLVAFNELRFSDGQEIFPELRIQIEAAKISASTSRCDPYLNDLWVLERYVDLLSKYGLIWKNILDQRFSDSWFFLQDALDLLRLIKKFSRIDINFFEGQLVELERLYPYNVFASIGATAELFECSICGKDIDSQECLHRRGHLYGGIMAHAIIRNIVQLDHVALVLRPRDKRCVVCYEDSGTQFKLVRYLSTLIAASTLRISDFGRLQFSKRVRANPHYRKVGRNDPCFCGSTKKFKHCCITRTHVEGEHVDIVAEPRCIEHAVA